MGPSRDRVLSMPPNERLAGVRIFKVPQKRRDVRCEGFGGLGFESFGGLAVGGFGVGFRVWHWREKLHGIAWQRSLGFGLGTKHLRTRAEGWNPAWMAKGVARWRLAKIEIWTPHLNSV